MDIYAYNSLNEKLRLCYNCLRGENGTLTNEENQEIEQEVKEYKKEMNALLFS